MQDDQPHTNATSKDYDLRLFAQLLRPSTLSGFICLLVGLFTVVGVITLIRYQGSSFQRDILGFQQSRENTQEQANEVTEEEFYSVSEDYGQINDSFAESNLIRNIPVMAFWMFVGTLVYFVVTGIGGAFGSARELGDELNFVHAKRKQMLREVYIKTAIRFGALVAWLLYITLFFRIILPYVLAAANVGSNLTLEAVPYVLLSFVILAVGLHIHAVMLRLVLLRPRVFSQETSF